MGDEKPTNKTGQNARITIVILLIIIGVFLLLCVIWDTINKNKPSHKPHVASQMEVYLIV